MKIVVVVDVQNDFVYGSLGSLEASDAVSNIIDQLSDIDKNDIVIFTRDTHGNHYFDTQEGRNLPVPHCVYGTEGWEVLQSVHTCVPLEQKRYVNKPIFGSYKLIDMIAEDIETTSVDEIEIFGFCTDICVISNALMIKSAFPEVKVRVISDCCAGVTPAKHEAALEVMRSCQIEVV